jgi:hypothetical protein
MVTSDYDEIYRLRAALDRASQPRHSVAYDQLHALFKSQGCTQPYSNDHLDDSGWRTISEDPTFLNCGQGLKATVTGEHIYRILGFRNLLKFTAPRLLGRPGDYERDWITFSSKQRTIDDWMPLQAFVGGSIIGRRQHTWWTNSDLTDDTLDVCHFIGLPDLWIPTRAVVLRSAITNVSMLKPTVPTILDGFDSPIFLATRDHDAPKNGRCIDLRSSPLAKGGIEVICPPIAVDLISCFAISLALPPPEDAKATLAALLPALRAFYESQ